MTSTLDTPRAAGEPSRPRLGRLVLVTVVCGLGVIGAVSVGYTLYALHAESAQARAEDRAAVRAERVAVVAQAVRHIIYAPAGWGADEYPQARGPKVSSFGRYGDRYVHLWQIPGDDIRSGSRDLWSLSTPASLCEFTADDRRADPVLAARVKTMRCSAVPGSRARIRVFPDYPKPGATDVRLAMALPEKGRYLNVWAVDETGEIAGDPVAWATDFIEHLEPFDVHGYSVEEIFQARDAAGWYGD